MITLRPLSARRCLFASSDVRLQLGQRAVFRFGHEGSLSHAHTLSIILTNVQVHFSGLMKISFGTRSNRSAVRYTAKTCSSTTGSSCSTSCSLSLESPCLDKNLPAQGQSPSREQCDFLKCFRNVSENRAGIGPERGRNGDGTKDFIRSLESRKIFVFIGVFIGFFRGAGSGI